MIPLILGAVALGSAAFGALAGVAGVADMNEAKEIGERAQKYHKQAVNELKADWEATNKMAEEYSQLQLDVMMRTIERFIAFIERNIGIVDGAIAAGNNDRLALHSITELAKSSPFQELANLASVRAALEDPDHEWTF